MEELLAKYFSGEATLSERSLVESWRSESKQNAKDFLEHKISWTSADVSSASYQGVLSSILDESPSEKESMHLSFGSTWVKYAAAAVLVLALGLLFLLNKTKTDLRVESLADGSEITIHGDSEVEVLTMDGQLREVRLTGKAYFDIERDEKRPFIIHTDNAVIEVLGTTFLIDSDDGDTEVCVETGLVGLTKTDGDLSVELEKGEMGLVSDVNKGIIKKINENPNYLAWKTKIITFKDAELSEVKRVLEDVYGITVVMDNPSLSNCKLTAKISKKKAKDAVEIIARTFNLEVEIEDKQVILSGKGC